MKELDKFDGHDQIGYFRQEGAAKWRQLDVIDGSLDFLHPRHVAQREENRKAVIRGYHSRKAL